MIVVLAIIIGALGGDSEEETPNLFQIAEEVTPMTDFGFDATYGDVFDWLMTDDRTSLEQDGDVAYLTFSGKVTGGDQPVAMVLKMTGLSVKATNQRLEPYAMTLNGTEVPDFNNPRGMLTELFWGQKNKTDYPTFMDFVSWDTENGIGTFDRYFEGLNSVENMYTTAVVSVEDAQALAETWMEDHPMQSSAVLMAEDETVTPENVAEMQYVFELWQSPRELDGLIYVRKSDGYLSYTPFHDGPLYDLDEWHEENYGTGVEAEVSADGLCFRGVPVDELLGASYDGMIAFLGEPDSTMYDIEENYYGDATICFDMWSMESPYLCIITSHSLDDITTYNGHPLSSGHDELSQILGREPDEAGFIYDTYSMKYNWDHMGSGASLIVNNPTTEDSMATTEVSISWWYT